MANLDAYLAAHRRLKDCEQHYRAAAAQLETVVDLMRNGDLEAEPDGRGLFILVGEILSKRPITYPPPATVANVLAELTNAQERLEAAKRDLGDVDPDALRRLAD